MARNTLARTLHDVGLAAWFGGTLMGAVGVNGAAADVDDPRQRARVANAGWARWTPVNLAAIGAHLTGGALLLKANRTRVHRQQGVRSAATVKTVFTAAALGATAYSRVLGQRIQHAGDVPVDGGTSPNAATPPDVASAQRQLACLQWGIPILTGGIIVTSALQGEQQRPAEVLRGSARQLARTVSSSMGAAVNDPQATYGTAKSTARELVRGAQPTYKSAKKTVRRLAKDAQPTYQAAVDTARGLAKDARPAAKAARNTARDVVSSAQPTVQAAKGRARGLVKSR